LLGRVLTRAIVRTKRYAVDQGLKSLLSMQLSWELLGNPENDPFGVDLE
jgi:hypothetical protein